MKKQLCLKMLAFLFLTLLNLTSVAQAESKYVSIGELLEMVPTRWQGDYQNIENKVISVDIPISLPQIETIPVVRITWGGPYNITDESISIIDQTKNQLIVEFPTASNKDTSYEQAPTVYVQHIQQQIPETQSIDLENYMLIEENSEAYGKRFRMAFYSKFHGIAYLISQNYRIDVQSERKGDLPAVPLGVSQGNLLMDKLGISLCAPRELMIEVEDIPLLNFDEIIKVFEQWIQDGYVYSLNEIRLGYMAFIDPDKKGEEFVLIPVWAAKGITRGDIGIPFYPDEDPETLAFMGYMNSTVCAVNAQTGEKYDFVYDVRKERRYVPHIITWNEVK